MLSRLPRRDRALLRRLTPTIPAARISRAIRFRHREAIGLQLGMNPRRAIGSMRTGVDRADARVRSASAVARAEAGRLAKQEPEAETLRTRAMVRTGYTARFALMNWKIRALSRRSPERTRGRLCQDVALPTQAMVLTPSRPSSSRSALVGPQGASRHPDRPAAPNCR